ncbi:MAG: excalibur calcium-binding domain-containing protein [Bacillus sp. (in: firmicutes)]
MRKWFAGICALGFLLAGQSAYVFAEEDRNCGDFSSKEEVMEFWYENGYSADNDPHDLDRDSDGLPCETSQSEYNAYVASKEDESNDEPASDSNSGTGSDQGAGNTEGEVLPDTATDNVSMIAIGAMIAAAGGILVLRKNKSKA